MSNADAPTLADAISRNVAPGDSVYITGFTHLIGFAAAHEIIRQRIDDLTLIRLTPDLVYDQMVAAGCARKLVFSYLGNPGVGSLAAIRRAIEGGEIEWEEYTHGALIAALRAGAQGAPFAPVPALGETDLPAHNAAIAFVRSPFAGERVAVVAPLRPDVAIVHAQRADAQGRIQVWGSTGDIPEAARAARRVIVTAEELVDEGTLRADPNRTLLLGRHVAAVVRVPFGAHPSYAQGMYGRDNRFYREWAQTSADPADLNSYLDEEVRATEGWDAHVERERERLDELSKVGESVPNSVNFGDNAAIAAVQE
jgi:glutaconate CoA-transferase subunit A